MGKRMPNQCILEETRYIPGVSYRWHSLFSALGSLANWGWIFQTSETDNVVQGTLEPPHKVRLWIPSKWTQKVNSGKELVPWIMVFYVVLCVGLTTLHEILLYIYIYIFKTIYLHNICIYNYTYIYIYIHNHTMWYWRVKLETCNSNNSGQDPTNTWGSLYIH